MRRLFVIAMATALFMSVAAGSAGAAPWEERANGGMVATDIGHAGLTVDLSVMTSPKVENYTAAHGKGQYSFAGNAFRLRVTHACVNAAEGTVTVWGPVKITSGSFKAETLIRGDKAYGVLSLLNEGDGIVSARAGIATDFFDGGLATMVAQQCEYPHEDAIFPATGTGALDFEAK